MPERANIKIVPCSNLLLLPTNSSEQRVNKLFVSTWKVCNIDFMIDIVLYLCFIYFRFSPPRDESEWSWGNLLRVAEFTVGSSTARTCGEYSSDAGGHVTSSLSAGILPLPEQEG